MAKKSKKMSDEEIISEVDKRTKKFMKAARAFLATKAGSTEVPVEWEVSVIMLETYYREFLELTMRIEQKESRSAETTALPLRAGTEKPQILYFR